MVLHDDSAFLPAMNNDDDAAAARWFSASNFVGASPSCVSLCLGQATWKPEGLMGPGGRRGRRGSLSAKRHSSKCQGSRSVDPLFCCSPRHRPGTSTCVPHTAELLSSLGTHCQHRRPACHGSCKSHPRPGQHGTLRGHLGVAYTQTS